MDVVEIRLCDLASEFFRRGWVISGVILQKDNSGFYNFIDAPEYIDTDFGRVAIKKEDA